MSLPERWAKPPAFDLAPPPEQAPVLTGLADVPGGRLFWWDTGGDGEAIVFQHPATGSAYMWLYQQPVFAKAGYRVIGWSRRGHRGSDPVDPSAPGSASTDLAYLLDALGIDRQVEIEADAAEREALAARFALQALEALAATATFHPVAAGIEAKGRMKAKAVQSCVITGEPVPAKIDLPFTIRFVAPDAAVSEEIELDAEELTCKSCKSAWIGTNISPTTVW
jgi:pimeloyl-ACP methyl ester carboxylesterase